MKSDTYNEQNSSSDTYCYDQPYTNLMINANSVDLHWMFFFYFFFFALFCSVYLRIMFLQYKYLELCSHAFVQGELLILYFYNVLLYHISFISHLLVFISLFMCLLQATVNRLCINFKYLLSNVYKCTVTATDSK